MEGFRNTSGYSVIRVRVNEFMIQELCSIKGIIKSIIRQTERALTLPWTAYLVCEPLFSLLGFRPRNRGLLLPQAKRVLVVRLDEIGDVIMMSPFLRELRRNLPSAWITLVVKPQIYNLVELCPYVNDVLTYDGRANGYFSKMQLHWRALSLGFNNLWRKRFDLAILPRWDVDYYHGSFVAYFSGSRFRVGYSENVTEEKKYLNRGLDMLFTHVFKNSKREHEVERNLDVIRALGGTIAEENLEIWISEKDKKFAKDLLSSNGVGQNDLLIAFGPGTPEPKRTWPVERFVELGVWLRNEYNAFIVVVGGKEDWETGKRIKSELGESVINSVGQTSLRQACALLAECQLYVGNDTGPKHMAAAAGLKIVEICGHPITGSTLHINSPVRFGPWGVPHIVVQSKKAIAPCFDACIAKRPNCILGITVDQIKEAVRNSLSLNNGDVFLSNTNKRELTVEA